MFFPVINSPNNLFIQKMLEHLTLINVGLFPQIKYALK